LERGQGVRLKLRRLFLYLLTANSYQLKAVFVFPLSFGEGSGGEVKTPQAILVLAKVQQPTAKRCICIPPLLWRGGRG